MFLTIVSFLMAMLRYSKMADRYKNDSAARQVWQATLDFK